MPDIIVLRVTDLIVTVGGRQMTNLPSTGTMVSFEPTTNASTFTPGAYGGGIFSRSNAKGQRVVLNVMANSSDDSWLFTAGKLLKTTNSVLPFSTLYQTSKYTGLVDIEVEPTREYSADTPGVATWTFVGAFDIFEVTSFVAPTALTADQITAAQG